MPFLDEGAKLVAGNVHSVEVGEAVEALDFLDLDLDLSPGNLMSVVVQITEGDGENTTAEGVGRDLWKEGVLVKKRVNNTYFDRQSC